MAIGKVSSIQRSPDAAILINFPSIGAHAPIVLWHAENESWDVDDMITLIADGVNETYKLEASTIYPFATTKQ